MSTETEPTTQVHGGRLVARRLRAHGVTKLFTLSGGHLFSIYDGCREEGIDLVDVRHEASAAFAAEGWAKVTRGPGVALVGGRAGLPNAVTGIANAIGQYLWSKALHLAPTTAVSPFYYFLLVWALAIGFVIWGDVPTIGLILGSVIVVVSGLFLLWHGARRRAAARPLSTIAAPAAEPARP